MRDVPRWWFALGALAVAAFAAYISLVPFNFRWPHRDAALLALFWRSLETHVSSKSNVLANAVMFAPFGFFGAGACVDERSGKWPWFAALVAVLIASVAVSVSIEWCQVFVPGRTPSLADIMAQTAGTAAGLAGWALLAREVRAFVATFMTGGRRALEVILAGYGGLQLLRMLQPLDVTVELSDIARKLRTDVVLNPFRSPTLNWAGIPAMLADFVLAVPVGVLAAIGFTTSGRRRSVPAAVALGVTFYVAGEIAQLFVRSRTVDIVDLAVNCLGMIAGVFLVASMSSRPAAAHAERSQGGVVAVTALVGAALLYAAYNLSPFDFVLSNDFIARRLRMLTGVPFRGYYQNQEFKALADIFIKVGMALPFGLLFQVRFRPDLSRTPRLMTAAWVAATGLFFLGVELGQVLVPSRYPDNTDVLLAIAGVWLGMRVAGPFVKLRT